MEKNTIETFIKKYHLNGLIEGVQLDIKNSTINLKARTADKTFMVALHQKKTDLPDASVGIMDSPQLLKQLGSLSENISLTYATHVGDANYVMGLVMDDGKLEQTHVCALIANLPDQPNLKSIPTTFDVEISLTDDFISTFLKAKNSLGAKLFTLVMNKKKQKLEMVLGYQEKNAASKSSLQLPTLNDKDTVTEPISFSADHLKEILAANSEVKDAVLKISEQGLACVEFDSPEFQSKYYMVKVAVED